MELNHRNFERFQLKNRKTKRSIEEKHADLKKKLDEKNQELRRVEEQALSTRKMI